MIQHGIDGQLLTDSYVAGRAFRLCVRMNNVTTKPLRGSAGLRKDLSLSLSPIILHLYMDKIVDKLSLVVGLHCTTSVVCGWSRAILGSTQNGFQQALDKFSDACVLPKPKSNLHYTRGITPKRVTSVGAHLCDLAPGYTAPKERRSGGEPLATLCRFHRSGDWTPNLPHRQRALSNWANGRSLCNENAGGYRAHFPRLPLHLTTLMKISTT